MDNNTADNNRRPQRHGAPQGHTGRSSSRYRDQQTRDSDSGRNRGARGSYRSSERRFDNDANQNGEGERRQRPYRNTPRVPIPELPEGVTIGMLDREIRARLRGLTKENAEFVGGHLAAAGAYLDVDPELSFEHARAAATKGGRVDVVREALGIAAYYTQRYPEAIRELRTYERISGSHEYTAVIADCERGRGMPRRALEIWQSTQPGALPLSVYVELGIVAAGARADLNQYDAALAVLAELTEGKRLPNPLRIRIAEAKVGILRQAGRENQAAELERRIPVSEDAQHVDVVVFDTVDQSEQDTHSDDTPTSTDKAFEPEQVSSPAADNGDDKQPGDEQRD